MAFLRSLLATIVGLLIFSGIACALFFFTIFVLSSQDDIPEVKENSVLYLKMSGPVVERTTEDPLQELLPSDRPRQIGLFNLLSTLEYAKTDEKIKGIYMENKMIAAGFSSLQEIRDALKSFKESGKFLYAYSEYMTEGDYLLASVADSIFLNPQGAIEINGLSANVTFFKGLFDKLGIEPEIFRVGDFKSFVEPYIRKDLSAENELQLTSLLNSLYSNYIREVAEDIQMDSSRFSEISNNMLGRLPEDFENLGLISRLVYEDEVKSLIKEKLSLEKDDKIDFVHRANYSRYAQSNLSNASKNKIAVIVANGDIVMGGNDENIVGEKFARQIRKARENDKVKAIVLRVNSPGGSLMASDIIWREVMLTKGVKPIIASMADVAASGGYFISMPCDTIVAQPNTITGSIGIFGMLFNLNPFLENKIGITHDVVKTGEFSDIMTVTRSLSDYERSIIQTSVDKGYETFITKAAEGRGMTIEDIKKVASGRVWTGEQAASRGLIDVLGSFDDAIKIAAQMAELEDYKISYYPEKKQFLQQFFDHMNEEVAAKFSAYQYGELTSCINKIKALGNYQGIQARMPFELEIR